MTRALVLGAGGVTGIAWMTGLLHGLENHGIELREADRLIGTSAGSAVAAQVSGPTPLTELARRQLDGTVAELPGRLSPPALVQVVGAMAFRLDKSAGLRRLGRAARRASDEALVAPRRAVIAQRLDGTEWSERDLRIPAVDIDTGELHVFDRNSPACLTDAVSASCAVPMVWPVVTLDGHRYMDGGVWSGTNIQLALGCDRVVVLAVNTMGVKRGLQHLGPGVRSVAITPDHESRRMMGRNSLDPAFRRPSTEAGVAQASRAAETIRAVWAPDD